MLTTAKNLLFLSALLAITSIIVLSYAQNKNSPCLLTERLSGGGKNNQNNHLLLPGYYFDILFKSLNMKLCQIHKYTENEPALP